MFVFQFKVLEIDTVERESDDSCIVMSDTEICFEGEPLSRDDDERLSEIGYDDIGGCHKQLAQVRAREPRDVSSLSRSRGRSFRFFGRVRG